MKGTLLTIVLAALPAAVQGQHFGSDQLHPSGFFGVGFTEPVNPVATRLDTGWSLAGGFGVTNRRVGLMLDAMFADLGINRSTLVRVGARRGDQKYWSVTLDPILHINQRGLVAFYVTGGGGIYSQITDYRFRSDNVGPYYGRDNFRGSYTLYKPGVDGGIGFSFPLAWHRDIRVFAEARYHHMFVGKSGVSFVPVTFGLRF